MATISKRWSAPRQRAATKAAEVPRKSRLFMADGVILALNIGRRNDCPLQPLSSESETGALGAADTPPAVAAD
jgi:hypothetical protein